MKYVLSALLLVVFTFSSFAQFKNIKLAEARSGDRYQPSEPSVAINLQDEKNIVVGVILDRIIYTEDGGQSWKETTVKSPFGVYGDPALVSDSKGNFYFFHLADPSGEGRSNEAWLDRIVVNKSKDKGMSWGDDFSIGHNPPKDQDKQWATVHPKTDNIYVTWTQFDIYGSKDPACQSNIMFSSSTNKGEKWSAPLIISQTPGDCVDDDNTAEGAVPAISNDGKLFVAWSNQGKIFLDRSFDGGDTWLRNDLAIFEQVGGWALDIPGIMRSNGMPVLVCDNNFKSPYNGMLYLIWADQQNGEGNTDIWFSRSNNFGDNWINPVKLNNDNTNRHQFFPWITVDYKTGYIYAVFYDRRDHEGNETDVYLAYSTDAGVSFKNVKISESAFVPDEKVFFGDYTNIKAHNGVIVPVWTRMDEGKTSVWTSIIKHDDLVNQAEKKK